MESGISEAIRNFASTFSVVVAAVSLLTSVRIVERKQSVDLILGGRNDKAFADGMRTIRRQEIPVDYRSRNTAPAVDNTATYSTHRPILIGFSQWRMSSTARFRTTPRL